MLLDHILNAGPVAMVLLALSVLVSALLMERLWVQLSYPFFARKEFAECRRLVCHQEYSQVEKRLSGRPHGWETAIAELLKHRLLDNDTRQQMAVGWLENERRYLNARLRLVGLIGSIAPLLGLLGTVFGIIEMFKAIAHSTGPVTPALLAEGMWTAMVTTALGLVIAIPALAASHGLEQLSQARIQTIQDALNELNLVISGKVANEKNGGTAVRAAGRDAVEKAVTFQPAVLAGTA
ncbi:MotA/TolQ/ExbB proton channel family protein [Porticoccus sp.]